MYFKSERIDIKQKALDKILHEKALKESELKKDIHMLLCQQHNQELQNAYFYLKIASIAQELGFDGTAAFFKRKSGEEINHAERFHRFILSRGSNIFFKDIPAPDFNYEIPDTFIEHALVESYSKEQMNSELINYILTYAKKENDYASEKFLLEFAVEQVEEENEFRSLIDRYQYLTASGEGLFLIDNGAGWEEGQTY